MKKHTKRKKHARMGEGFIAAFMLAVFVLAGLGIYIGGRIYVPPASGPKWIDAGREEAHAHLVRLIREDEAALIQMLDLVEEIPDQPYLKYADALSQSPVLAAMMKERSIAEIEQHPRMRVFDSEYSAGMATSSAFYQILYTTDDPKQLVKTWNHDTEWFQEGNAWIQRGDNYAYIEQVSDCFYYFYCAT